MGDLDITVLITTFCGNRQGEFFYITPFINKMIQSYIECNIKKTIIKKRLHWANVRKNN